MRSRSGSRARQPPVKGSAGDSGLMINPVEAQSNTSEKIVARRRRVFRAVALLNDEALHGARNSRAVRQPRRGEARAVGADQGFLVEQIHSPTAGAPDDGEIGIDKGPFPEIQRGRSTVRRSPRRPRRASPAKSKTPRPSAGRPGTRSRPDRARRTGRRRHAAKCPPRMDWRRSPRAGLRLIGSGKVDRPVGDTGRQRQSLRPDLEGWLRRPRSCRGEQADRAELDLAAFPAALRCGASAAPAARGASDRW